ncbi:MAG: hypothetical protein QOD02_2429, partial [Mycobacterium sp.]|nr:hypothetical protein [Mycobacterium sp.]
DVIDTSRGGQRVDTDHQTANGTPRYSETKETWRHGGHNFERDTAQSRAGGHQTTIETWTDAMGKHEKLTEIHRWATKDGNFDSATIAHTWAGRDGVLHTEATDKTTLNKGGTTKVLRPDDPRIEEGRAYKPESYDPDGPSGPQPEYGPAPSPNPLPPPPPPPMDVAPIHTDKDQPDPQDRQASVTAPPTDLDSEGRNPADQDGRVALNDGLDNSIGSYDGVGATSYEFSQPDGPPDDLMAGPSDHDLNFTPAGAPDDLMAGPPDHGEGVGDYTGEHDDGAAFGHNW